MPANFKVPLSQEKYAEIDGSTLASVTAAKSDPLFVFDGVNFRVEFHGEYRDLTGNLFRKTFGDLLSRDLRDPEKAMQFATNAYKQLTETRRDDARKRLGKIARPGGNAIGPTAGVTGQMDAAQAGQHMLANSGGLVMGYDHSDQDSKDFTTELILKSGGTQLKHLFVEEFTSEMQTEINDFLDDRAAVMGPNLLARINELRNEGAFHVDFEPLLYAARDKGVKIWGIDTAKADPGVPKDDPRYHERRLVLMNEEARRVFKKVRADYPNEPFLAMTGQQHLNTAEGGVPGLAQIMRVPGVCHDAKSKRLAFVPEDTSKRAKLSPCRRACVEAILKKAGEDYKVFYSAYSNTQAYLDLPDPKPRLESKLNGPQLTEAAQGLANQFVRTRKLKKPANIPGLLNDPAIASTLTPIFQATVLRAHRREQVGDAIKSGDLATLQGALNADPYLLKLPADDTKGDTLLHAACESGHPAIVQEIAGRPGVNVNATDQRGHAPIHRALGEREGTAPSLANLADVVGHLLAGGANANLADPSGNTGLELSKTGPHANAQLIQKFVTANAAPATDLFVSKFVEAAAAKYASVRQPVGDVEFDEEEARQSAKAFALSLPTQGIQLGNATEVDAAMNRGRVKTELTRLTNLFQARRGHQTTLVEAINEKDIGKMRGALNADPRLGFIPIDGNRMALGLAAIQGFDSGIDELVVQRHVPVDQKNSIGRTALHEVLAQEIRKTDVVGLQEATLNAFKLINHGADVNARNRRGETAMHLAGYRNNKSMIRALKGLPARTGPDLTARDNRGWTPVDTALGSTNREAEELLRPGTGSVAAPLKAGKLSTVDILCQATLCEDMNDAPKVRKFMEQLYANDDLRPLLILASAAASGDHKPPDGGLRFFASHSNTVGSLYVFDRSAGPSGAYDEKVNTLLFPMEDGNEGKAFGTLAHEITHLTTHLVTNDPATVPFSSDQEKTQYLDAIKKDVRKLQLLDDSDPVQKYIKDRFSGRMDDYLNKEDVDKALLQEFIVGVPQVAAVYGMDELKKHMPGLVTFYKDVWVPKVQHAFATDGRFAAGRAKIDAAANGRLTQALNARKIPALAPVDPIVLKPGDKRLGVDRLMRKIEDNFVATKGQPDPGITGRTIHYKLEDFKLSQGDRDDFDAKKAAIRAAITEALSAGNFPPDIDLNEIRDLVETVTNAAVNYSGSNLKTALKNRAGNWVKDAKVAYVYRAAESIMGVDPEHIAEAVVYQSEARARHAGQVADLDPDTDVKASKQREAIQKLTATLNEPGNKKKLKDPAKLISELSGVLSDPTAKAFYQKPKSAATHVSVDVKKAKTEWLLKLANM